jgi:hypothetical protein
MVRKALASKVGQARAGNLQLLRRGGGSYLVSVLDVDGQAMPLEDGGLAFEVVENPTNDSLLAACQRLRNKTKRVTYNKETDTISVVICPGEPGVVEEQFEGMLIYREPDHKYVVGLTLLNVSDILR